MPSISTRSDRLWFGLQLTLCMGMVVAPVVQRQRVPRTLQVLAFSLLLSGGGTAAAGYAALGRRHSPWSRPDADARLVTSGIYHHVRHSIYLGWSVTAFGTSLLSGSLLGLVVAATITIFYDVRARHEERLLVQRYPSYAQYALSSSRFIPGVY